MSDNDDRKESKDIETGKQPDRTTVTILKEIGEQLKVIEKITGRTQGHQIADLVSKWIMQHPITEKHRKLFKLTDADLKTVCHVKGEGESK